MKRSWYARFLGCRQTSRRRSPFRSSIPACVEILEDRSLLTQFIAVGTDAGPQNQVRILADNDQNGQYETQTTGLQAFRFSPFNDFAGGIRVAFGDFDGDRNDELVVAAGPGAGPHVIIYKMSSGGIPGDVVDSFFAYGAGFRGGVFIAAGDIDGDGRDELITAPDAGGGPHVRIFSDVDRDGFVSDNAIDNVFPYGGFSGGVRLAVGDIDNDGREDLITAPGPGGGPEITVFRDIDGDGRVSDQGAFDRFNAYDPGFRGGVYLAAGPISGAGSNGDELITSPGPGGGPHVKIFSDLDNDGRASDDALFDQFFPYPANFFGGVRLAAGDTNNTGGNVEVITVPGPGGGSDLRIFGDNGDSGRLFSDNPLEDQRFVFPGNNTAGFFVATGIAFRSQFNSPPGTPNIPDNGTLNSSIFVPSSAGIVRDLDVRLFIDHTFNEDLDVVLRHIPSGRAAFLFSDIGGSGDGIFVVLNDQVSSNIRDQVTSPIVGTFETEFETLSTFNGLNASGEWRLAITDDDAGATGELLSWGLDFRHD